MFKNKVIISLLSTFFIVGLLAMVVYYVKFRQNTGPSHAGTIKVQLVSTTSTVKKNDVFNVDVYLDTQGVPVTGADIRVRYDPAKLVATSVTPGNFLPVVFVPGKINVSSALVQLVLGANLPNPANGTGILAHIKFKVISQGTRAHIYTGPDTAISTVGSAGNVMGVPGEIFITIQ